MSDDHHFLVHELISVLAHPNRTCSVPASSSHTGSNPVGPPRGAGDSDQTRRYVKPASWARLMATTIAGTRIIPGNRDSLRSS